MQKDHQEIKQDFKNLKEFTAEMTSVLMNLREIKALSQETTNAEKTFPQTVKLSYFDIESGQVKKWVETYNTREEMEEAEKKYAERANKFRTQKGKDET